MTETETELANAIAAVLRAARDETYDARVRMGAAATAVDNAETETDMALALAVADSAARRLVDAESLCDALVRFGVRVKARG